MRVGLLLSGCGVQDGSEVYEAVLSILALERGGAQVQAIAPDTSQAEIVNHYSGEEVRGETRTVLAESARITRGKIVSTREVSAHDLDALVIVGGTGVVKNLCSYASDGAKARINPDCERLITEMTALGKPIGALGLGGFLVALALRGSGKNPSLAPGGDATTAARFAEIGASYVAANADEIHIDTANSIVSTAGLTLAAGPLEAEPGISALVSRVLAMAREVGSSAHSGSLSMSDRTQAVI